MKVIKTGVIRIPFSEFPGYRDGWTLERAGVELVRWGADYDAVIVNMTQLGEEE